ncbi:F-box only protein 5 [Scyliorhinus canicula]|uniref:F-box only protein 5 n=1 Tax=Scyliorhinus canicula TaxID=7830 RepID=UPI0018F7C63E|nr:F-box only protein 5 [Scyliorhinus canicula]
MATSLGSFAMRGSHLTISRNCTVRRAGDSEKLETCPRKMGSLQDDLDSPHHHHHQSDPVDCRITSPAVGELIGTVPAKENPHRKPPGCSCACPDCNPASCQDSGYLSLLSQPSLLIDEEGDLVPDADHRARSSPEGRGCTGGQPCKCTLGKGMEDPTSITRVHSVTANTRLENKPVNPPAGLKGLPALQAGWTACQVVDHEKDQLKETLQEQECNVKNLIGRKMGLEYVDICKELLDRGVPQLLKIIQGFLPPTDLLICAKVSKTWRRIIFDNKTRRQLLKEASHLQKGSAANLAGERTIRRYTVSRGALSSVQRVGVNSPQKSSLQTFSPVKLNPNSQNWIRNQRIVKTLKWDETLKTCPLCNSAARFMPHEQRAVCINGSCSYDYCTLCFHTFHGSKDCACRHFRKRSQLQPQAGSKRSKRNLKRL